MAQPFWQTKQLSDMTQPEWESLCDGCGKCCLHKLEDEDDGEVYYTNIACRYLDSATCRCLDYSKRKDLVPECVTLTHQQISDVHWLPATCAYRLLANNEPLPQWHPLVTGNSNSVHESGNSVQGKVQAENEIEPDDYQDYVITWVE